VWPTSAVPVIGQPNLEFHVDRAQAARYGINVADVQERRRDRRRGKAVSQVLQGEQRYDLVVRYQAPYRDTSQAIQNIRLLAPSGERVSLAQLCQVRTLDGASESTAKATRATWPSSTAFPYATSAALLRRHEQGRPPG